MRKYLDAIISHETKYMTKEEWLEARRGGIGGSDASSVLGFNPYKSSISVYLEKIQNNNLSKDLERKDGISLINKNQFKEEVSYKMELGNKLEEFVAREFTLKTGKKVRNINGILKNDNYPFALANIDRAVVGEKAFLECKVTNSFSKKLWKKEVPMHYQIQMTHYMAITGATHCYVAALIGNEDLVIHKIYRDEELISKVMNLEKRFWDECVLGESLPNPDGSDDYSNMLQGIYKDSKKEELILFEKDDLMSRYDEVCELSKDIYKEKKTIEQYIQSQMKDYEVAYLGDRKITWKTQIRNSLDSKKLKKEYPELVDRYMKTTTSRVFRMS
ncbi:YqaJ viral recombinase family nuclease [Paraclostridium sordellii]|uniref:YqaJ viral recombinase family nuclease n=1 Tax=Paraclostridium sordellii TaxID=1505 RepID=UPI0005E1EA2D|nr:YqaJ viral recombinase family protein [Paeniclostridium sordellii]CEN92956.1 phage-type endonuclease [[Clostridium] sordellii] [Paeniclostridium sordellii]CEN96024.1 phage-type endonuclease [[Clostridium] sordellii] [Paeniclostridium sordellii]